MPTWGHVCRRANLTFKEGWMPRSTAGIQSREEARRLRPRCRGRACRSTVHKTSRGCAGFSAPHKPRPAPELHPHAGSYSLNQRFELLVADVAQLVVVVALGTGHEFRVPLTAWVFILVVVLVVDIAVGLSLGHVFRS